MSGRSKQVDSGVDRAGAMAKDRMDDKYDSKIDMGASKAKEAVDKLDGSA